VKSYHVGKLGVAEGIALVFGMIVSRLFLSGMSDGIRNNGQLYWLAMILFTLIPLVVLFMMVYVNNSVSGDIVVVCKHLVGKAGAWLIVIAYSGMFFANSVLVLRQYAEYTLSTALPRADFQLVIVWYAVTAGVICYLGIEALCRASCILLPFMLVGLFLIFAMVSPFYIVYNLTPWQGNGIMTVVESGVHGVGYNMGVLSLVFLSSAFQNTKTIKSAAIYAISGSLVLRIVDMLVYTMVFGVAVGGEKTMPFYELARLVYVNQYIQRIEALFIVVWVMFGLMAIAGSMYMGLYLIVVLLKLPGLRPIAPLGAIIVANLAMLPPDIGTTIRLDQLLVQVSQVGIYLFPGILFVMALVKKRRKKSCADI